MRDDVGVGYDDATETMISRIRNARFRTIRYRRMSVGKPYNTDLLYCDCQPINYLLFR